MIMPCKDCLVFSLCKSRLWDSKKEMHFDEFPLRTYGIVGMAENENCVKLSEYVLHHPNSPEVAVNKVREVFSLRPVIYTGGGPTLETLRAVIRRAESHDLDKGV